MALSKKSSACWSTMATHHWLKACAFCCACLAATVQADRSDQISDAELKAFLAQSVDAEQQAFDRYDAEVWLLGMSSRMARYRVSAEESQQILRAVYREAKQFELEPDLVLAVIAIESSFNRFAVSSAGAQGLMQVMPFWKRELGRDDDNLTDIDTNIRYGCSILKYYLGVERGDLVRALARYNGSLGKTHYPELVLVNWEQYWRSGRL